MCSSSPPPPPRLSGSGGGRGGEGVNLPIDRQIRWRLPGGGRRRAAASPPLRLSVACPLASSCPTLCDRTAPLVLWATDEPIFLVRFCVDRLFCARATAQSSFVGGGLRIVCAFTAFDAPDDRDQRNEYVGRCIRHCLGEFRWRHPNQPTFLRFFSGACVVSATGAHDNVTEELCILITVALRPRALWGSEGEHATSASPSGVTPCPPFGVTVSPASRFCAPSNGPPTGFLCPPATAAQPLVQPPVPAFTAAVEAFLGDPLPLLQRSPAPGQAHLGFALAPRFAMEGGRGSGRVAGGGGGGALLVEREEVPEGGPGNCKRLSQC